MPINKFSKEEKGNLLRSLLNLSNRISRHSPPMKPFIRFSKALENQVKNDTTKVYSHLFWDFDYTLQKILLNIIREIATPEEIACVCVEQWKTNLERLYKIRKKELEKLIRDKAEFTFYFRPRDEFILSRVTPGSRFLYIGCGAGTECLRLAKRGLQVVGIDTDPTLIDIANDWAKHLHLPFKAVCMDLMALNFEPKSFDSFLLEFYGNQLSRAQSMAAQRNLAGILNDQGKGFIVGSRKKYASFWFLMGSHHSSSMTKWLIPQHSLDFCFSHPDACEERLMYGLYNKSHTLQSLSSELDHTFDVVECLYEKHDPRYVMAVVTRKKHLDSKTLPVENSNNQSKRAYPKQRHLLVTEIITKVEAICTILESHAEKVSQFFNDKKTSSAKNPLSFVKTDLAKFIELLNDIFKNFT